MLDAQFKHAKWFKGQKMTVKDFLDYVLSVSGDFCIISKYNSDNGILFDGSCEYFINGEGGKYKIDREDAAYLAEKNTYFKSKLEGYYVS